MIDWNDLWIVGLVMVGLGGVWLWARDQKQADWEVVFSFFGLVCGGMAVFMVWMFFVYHPYVPPTPNEVCAERGGVRQVAPSTGWGGGPYVVCMDGYSTEDVMA